MTSNRERGLFEGAIHHVWQRGNNKDFIFKNDNVKRFFIRQLKTYNKKFDYNILAYVVMNNHYHLLIQTFKDPIGKVMFNINNVTAKFIKDKLKRNGHIFQGRFNSKLVRTNAYFIWLVRYIHRNPVRAKICENVEDYKWSSHHLYVKGHSSFVNVGFSLSKFNSDINKAYELYFRMMNSDGYEESPSKDFKFFKENLNLYDKYEGSKINDGLKFKLPKRTSIQKIIYSLNLQPDVIHLLTSGSRKRYLTDIKISLAQKALHEKYTLAEIASYLNTTESALSKLIIAHK